jgi:hypothetical protein
MQEQRYDDDDLKHPLYVKYPSFLECMCLSSNLRFVFLAQIPMQPQRYGGWKHPLCVSYPSFLEYRCLSGNPLRQGILSSPRNPLRHEIRIQDHQINLDDTEWEVFVLSQILNRPLLLYNKKFPKSVFKISILLPTKPLRQEIRIQDHQTNQDGKGVEQVLYLYRTEFLTELELGFVPTPHSWLIIL